MNDKIWPVVKLDLDYTAAHWNRSGYVLAYMVNHWFIEREHRFDLWEEVSSSSFFTTAVQLRALREGVTLATKLGRISSAAIYDAQLPNVYCFLQVRVWLFRGLYARNHS